MFADHTMAAYASERLKSLCAEIDRTGSFAEYNSPAYAHGALIECTSMRMVWREEAARARAAAIERRLWLHLAAHWDAPRHPLAGPQSRANSTDFGQPVWLDKSLGGRLGLYEPGHASPDAETAVHAVHCPDDLAAKFLDPVIPREHKELFVPGTQGTTYLTKRFSLGSVNRGDFWVQRRPLLAYFDNGARPCSWMTMRVIKDDYDFASAQLF